MKNRTALQRTINKLPILFEYPQAIAGCLAQDDIDEAFRLCQVMQRELNLMKRDYRYACKKADRY